MGGACCRWLWIGTEHPFPQAWHTFDIFSLIWALWNVQRQRVILTLGLIVCRGCPSYRWQVCRSARGWWEGVCRVSAEETNNSKEPQCHLLRHGIGRQKIYLLNLGEFYPWVLTVTTGRDLLNTTDTAYVWQLCCDIILHILEIFHNWTFECQHCTIDEQCFKLSILRRDVRLSVTRLKLKNNVKNLQNKLCWGKWEMRSGIKLQESTILASLSAKWRAPFRQREERLRVFSSPSSNTAEMRDIILGCCM